MASAHKVGSARITYTPPGGSPTVFLLAVPLSPLPDFRPADVRTSFQWEAANRRDRRIVTLVGGAQELACAIRFDDQPAELLAMLRAGLRDDVVFSYQETEGGTAYPLKLWSVGGASDGRIELQLDRERGGFGEWEVQVEFRRVDGGSLEGLLLPEAL